TPAVQPAGQPQAGDKFSVTLQSATSGTLTFSYTAIASDTQASVARALAQLISTAGLPEFRATSAGSVLHIDNVAGNVFSTVFAASTQYEEIVAPLPGDVWSVTLQTGAGVPVVFSTTAGANATPASVASALALLINASPAFDATSQGGVLRIVSVPAATLFTSAVSLNGKVQAGDVEALSAVIATRIDGINY